MAFNPCKLTIFTPIIVLVLMSRDTAITCSPYFFLYPVFPRITTCRYFSIIYILKGYLKKFFERCGLNKLGEHNSNGTKFT